MSGVFIRRSECFRLVNSSTTFTLAQDQLNPGLPSIFPWLSQVAPNFEQYRWHHLSFTFASTASDSTNTTNTALGVVMTGISYDSYDPNFSSRLEMANYTGVKRCRPCDNMVYEANLSTLATRNLFVRTGPVPADADRRLYDIGTFNFATDGAQAANQVGELWVHYVIELFKPRLDPIGDSRRSVFQSSGASGLLPLGASGSVTTVFDELGAVVTPTTITIPPQSGLPNAYQVNISWIGTPAGSIAYPVVTLTNCTAFYQNGPEDGAFNCGQAVMTASVSVTDPTLPVVLTFGAAGTLPTAALCYIRIYDTIM